MAPHGSNFTNHHNSAARVATDPSGCTVDVHGQGSNAVRLGETTLSPRQLASIIRTSGDWGGEKPIRLISCQTGSQETGFAAQLSGELVNDQCDEFVGYWDYQGQRRFYTAFDNPGDAATYLIGFFYSCTAALRETVELPPQPAGGRPAAPVGRLTGGSLTSWTG
ncbi:hypothetical protein [Actinosynnema mirum]|uniref:hypothetical protein n=1 Tax=Actinosynnema mirum TaxID=40567 RepID=UPI00019AC2D3|nr:hypothetical protein [Actinosynnema mirum]